MENGSLVEPIFCAGQERPVSFQPCLELPCPTEAPSTTTTPLPTTQTPITGPVPTVTTAVPSLALAGFRPQPFQIHIDPELNNLVPTSNWNPESNEIMQTIGTWRTGDWSQVARHFFLTSILFSVDKNYFSFLFSSVRQAAGEECEGEVSYATTC